MNELFDPLLYHLMGLPIILIGIAVIFGFPFDRLLKMVVRWWLILLVIVITAPMIPVVLDQLQKNPSRPLQEFTMKIFPKILPLVGIIVGVDMLFRNGKLKMNRRARRD